MRGGAARRVVGWRDAWWGGETRGGVARRLMGGQAPRMERQAPRIGPWKMGCMGELVVGFGASPYVGVGHGRAMGGVRAWMGKAGTRWEAVRAQRRVGMRWWGPKRRGHGCGARQAWQYSKTGSHTCFHVPSRRACCSLVVCVRSGVTIGGGVSTITLPDLRGPANLKPPNSGGTSPERGERKGDEVTGMGVLGSMKRATKVYSAMPLSMRTRRRERKRASRGSF